MARTNPVKRLSKTVWVLSLVSLFTDMASEMLYPIMPIYLKQIGFSVLWIGVLEGFAEATAGLSKGYFGQRSDRAGKRVPFVQLGYGLSALSKPLLAVSVLPLWIFLVRWTDRLGKGVRTGARDALLSDEATPATKGTIFGFHRSMDTLGAALGPALALLYLAYRPGDYRTLFLIAFAPGLVAVLATGLLKDRPPASVAPLAAGPRITLFSFARYWKLSSPAYRRLVGGLLAFALLNSSDVFLLLKAKEAGLDDTHVIGVYIFYNLVYALLAYPIGSLADRIGLKRVFLMGLGLFAVVYFGMALGRGLPLMLGCFALYGVYAAATEGVAKAWISNLAPREELATAIGTFTAFQSLAALLASSIAGAIWLGFGAQGALLVTAAGALAVLGYMALRVESPARG